MELRSLTVFLAVFVLAVFTHSSETRHSIHRRDADAVNYADPLSYTATESNYDDPALGDEAFGDEAQNDGEDFEEVPVNDTILNQGERHVKLVGATVQLKCKVSHKHSVVLWMKDNQNIFLGTTNLKGDHRRSTTSDSFDHDLKIEKLVPSDSGKYTCQIEQESPVSIVHTLTVTEKNPNILRFEASDGGHLVEGQDLLLTCDVTGIPKPQIIWSKYVNGGSKRLTEKDGIASSNTFFIRNVKKEMAGKYFCYVMNSEGHSEAYVNVNIAGKPRVHVHKTVVNTAIGVEALLQCSVHEESSPYIRWYKDGRLIEDTSSFYQIIRSGSSSNLTVTPRVDSDFGTFTCEAENRHGKHNRSIELVERPVVENIDVDGTTLTWTIHSHQPLEQIELQLRSLNEDASMKTIQVPLPKNGNKKSHEYEIVYILEDKELEAGKYEVFVRAKNQKNWSSHNEPKVVEIDTQAEPIRTASVFRSTGGAHTLQSTSAVLLTTTFMYLLVRMM